MIPLNKRNFKKIIQMEKRCGWKRTQSPSHDDASYDLESNDSRSILSRCQIVPNARDFLPIKF